MKKIAVSAAAVLFMLFSLESWAGGVTILNVSGLGVVKANPAQRRLVFHSYGGPMEFSVCWNELHWMQGRGLYVGGERCIQGEVGGWAKKAFRRKTRAVTMPHYRTFTVVISRYGSIAAAICRENDGRLGCVRMGK